MSGCGASEVESESKTLDIQLNISQPDNLMEYRKILDYDWILEAHKVGYYECRVHVSGVKYRISFWPNLYPSIDSPSVEVRYSLNDVSGGGVVLSEHQFSVYDRSSNPVWMSIQIWDTDFVSSLVQEYPDHYPNNLDCIIMPR